MPASCSFNTPIICSSLNLLRFMGREIDRHDPQAWFSKLSLPVRRQITDCEVYEYVEVMP